MKVTDKPLLTGKQAKELFNIFPLLRKALIWNADGVVVGATAPQKIGEVKQILQDKVDIYSPGVGAQGGSAETAIKAGANYLIVGREITNSNDPTAAARSLCELIKGL